MAPCSESFWIDGGVNDREMPEEEWPLMSGGGADEEVEAEEIPL